jgi:[acyl-carrier-protein] S-malonyltransferase
VVVVANHNTPQQLVVTGEGEAVATAAVLAKAKGGKAMALPVSGAWHSPLMAKAAEDFARELEKTAFAAPVCPVVLNVTGRPETDPAAIQNAMIRQIISPVKWCDATLAMIDAGVTTFIEAGPKNVLAGLVKKTAPKDLALTILPAGDLAQVDQAVQSLRNE